MVTFVGKVGLQVGVLVHILERNRINRIFIDTYKYTYIDLLQEWTHVIVEAKKQHDLPRAS